MTSPIHKPIDQTIHPSMGGEVSADFKSLNRIEIDLSWFIQVLLHFNWFGRVPMGVGGMGGYRWGRCGCIGGIPCMHAHTHKYDIGNFWGFPQWKQPFAIEIMSNMCACKWSCVGTPIYSKMLPHSPAPSPRVRESQNHQVLN